MYTMNKVTFKLKAFHLFVCHMEGSLFLSIFLSPISTQLAMHIFSEQNKNVFNLTEVF
jgi:hypothetical protein